MAFTTCRLILLEYVDDLCSLQRRFWQMLSGSKTMTDAKEIIVCWSRMQAEAGQGLANIVARKELERQAGAGRFFWGVGNPPSTATAPLAALRKPVDALFSIMKTSPKVHDVTPERVRMWSRYVGLDGRSHSIPKHVLITSRVNSRKHHYALECYSAEMLELSDHGPFDQNAYRNISGTGGKIGSSQVTALVRQIETPKKADYRINLKSRLTGGYWVKLTDPIELSSSHRSLIERFDPTHGLSAWLEVLTELRSAIIDKDFRTTDTEFEEQTSFFDNGLNKSVTLS